MTRQEQKYLKECKEKQFIESIKGQKIDGKTKAEFRLTDTWKNFRKYIHDKYKVDYLTKRKLTKTWNCHHERFDPKLYTDLNEEFFLPLNNQQHDVLHIVISETIKDPTYLDRLCELVHKHIKLNDGKDVKDFLKY